MSHTLNAALMPPAAGENVLAGEKALARLAQSQGVSPPFQNHGWLAAWLEAQEQTEVFRLAQLGTAQAGWLFPLLITRRAGLAVAQRVGGSHASLFAPVRLGTPAPLTSKDFRALARMLGVDALLLTDCAAEWQGSSVLGEAFSPAPDLLRAVTFTPATPPGPAGEAGKKLRAKARKLGQLGRLEAEFLEGETAQRAYGTMCDWKGAQFAERGIRDPFTEAAMRTFVTRGLENDALALFALTLDSRPVAAILLARSGSGGHVSGMMIAHDPAPEIARCGPGDVLLMRLVEALHEQGATGFDLGAGDARYKRLHCPLGVPLFDVLVPAGLRGSMLVAAFGLARRLKRLIKGNEALFGAFQRLRSRLAR